jgi:hypothetical protein
MQRARVEQTAIPALAWDKVAQKQPYNTTTGPSYTSITLRATDRTENRDKSETYFQRHLAPAEQASVPWKGP